MENLANCPLNNRMKIITVGPLTLESNQDSSTLMWNFFYEQAKITCSTLKKFNYFSIYRAFPNINFCQISTHAGLFKVAQLLMFCILSFVKIIYLFSLVQTNEDWNKSKLLNSLVNNKKHYPTKTKSLREAIRIHSSHGAGAARGSRTTVVLTSPGRILM